MSSSKRTRSRVDDLPSVIPNVPRLDGEDSLDVKGIAKVFTSALSEALSNAKLHGFEALFTETAYWRDNLTLTFDKRTLHGRKDVVEAWQKLAIERHPAMNTAASEDEMLGLSPKFTRLGKTFAYLDVPFSFRVSAPASECIGMAKLIPVDGEWKIWCLGTSIRSLRDYPFQQLPRKVVSGIKPEQRGISEPHGLPDIDSPLDAVVIGGNSSGLANAIMLDSIGTNVAVFDQELQAGGTWANRYRSLQLHHNTKMLSLPTFPVPREVPEYHEYLYGYELARYYKTAVEQLKLPLFSGVKVLRNEYNKGEKLWHVTIEDVASPSKGRMIVKARNIVLSNGFIFSEKRPKMPALADREFFKGIVKHVTEYNEGTDYEGKNVIVVGSSNSAHDVARDLVDHKARSITLLQRSPAILIDHAIIKPMTEASYQGQYSIEAADFVDSVLPMGVIRDMARGALQMMIGAMGDRNTRLEEKGYILDKTPCLISIAYEGRGRNFFIDCDTCPGTLDLVLEDKIKVANGDAIGFTDTGLLVRSKDIGDTAVLNANAIIFATGYEEIDINKDYVESGFMDSKSAQALENTSVIGVDTEGELPGYVTFSGHPHLYFSAISVVLSRLVARQTAVQIKADVEGIFPGRYERK